MKIKNENLQIETLRTLQKDEEIISDINQTFINILTKLRINKLNFNQNANVSILSRFLYYTLTSLSNLQTLGEEYTGLIRVDSSRRSLVSKPVSYKHSQGSRNRMVLVLRFR